jgi:hypothetical protein
MGFSGGQGPPSHVCSTDKNKEKENKIAFYYLIYYFNREQDGGVAAT